MKCESNMAPVTKFVGLLTVMSVYTIIQKYVFIKRTGNVIKQLNPVDFSTNEALRYI
jgi:hypothetical protein